jgi:hypothetical protein
LPIDKIAVPGVWKKQEKKQKKLKKGVDKLVLVCYYIKAPSVTAKFERD